MIVALTVAVSALAIAVTFNLIVTAAAVRRLREHAEFLNRPSASSRSALRLGQRAPELVGELETGQTFALRDLDGSVAIAFFSADCAACREHQPEFLDLTRQERWDHAVMVLSGPRAVGADLLDNARGTCDAVVEDSARPISRSFEVHMFPSFVLVRDGLVEAVENYASRLATRGAEVLR